MKTITLIAITAVSLGLLPACTSYDQGSARGDTPEPKPTTVTTSSTQHGTLLQGSPYDSVNRVGQ